MKCVKRKTIVKVVLNKSKNVKNAYKSTSYFISYSTSQLIIYLASYLFIYLVTFIFLSRKLCSSVIYSEAGLHLFTHNRGIRA